MSEKSGILRITTISGEIHPFDIFTKFAKPDMLRIHLQRIEMSSSNQVFAIDSQHDANHTVLRDRSQSLDFMLEAKKEYIKQLHSFNNGEQRLRTAWGRLQAHEQFELKSCKEVFNGSHRLCGCGIQQDENLQSGEAKIHSISGWP